MGHGFAYISWTNRARELRLHSNLSFYLLDVRYTLQDVYGLTNWSQKIVKIDKISWFLQKLVQLNFFFNKKSSTSNLNQYRILCQEYNIGCGLSSWLPGDSHWPRFKDKISQNASKWWKSCFKSRYSTGCSTIRASIHLRYFIRDTIGNAVIASRRLWELHLGHIMGQNAWKWWKKCFKSESSARCSHFRECIHFICNVRKLIRGVQPYHGLCKVLNGRTKNQIG